MNILSHVDPVVITMEYPAWGGILIVPVTVKPGYVGRLCKFMVEVTLETENPADIGGYVMLESIDYAAY